MPSAAVAFWLTCQVPFISQKRVRFYVAQRVYNTSCTTCRVLGAEPLPEQQSRDGRPGFHFTLFQQTPLRLTPLGPQGDKRLLLRGPSVQNPSLQQRAPPGAASCLPRGAEPGPPQAAAPRRAPAPCARGVRRRSPARASGGRQRASRQAGAEAAPHLCPTPAARPRLASRLAPLPSPSPRRPSQLGGGSAPERASTSLPPSSLPSPRAVPPQVGRGGR